MNYKAREIHMFCGVYIFLVCIMYARKSNIYFLVWLDVRTAKHTNITKCIKKQKKVYSCINVLDVSVVGSREACKPQRELCECAYLIAETIIIPFTFNNCGNLAKCLKMPFSSRPVCLFPVRKALSLLLVICMNVYINCIFPRYKNWCGRIRRYIINYLFYYFIQTNLAPQK